MAAPTKAISAGSSYAFLGFLDSNGYLTGASTTAPVAAAAGSMMLRLLGIKTASPTIPEPDVTQITGDDILLGEFTWDSNASRAFVIEVAVMDMTTEALLTGTNVQTWGQVSVGALDVAERAEDNVCLILQSRAKKQDTGVKGQAAWSGVIIPLATAQVLGRVSYSEREGAVYRINITPQLASYTPAGVTISTANEGTTGVRYYPFTSENPITMIRHTGNAVLATFNVSADYPVISAAKVYTHSNRVQATVSSVNTSTPSFTLSSAPADGAAVVTLYEFDV